MSHDDLPELVRLIRFDAIVKANQRVGLNHHRHDRGPCELPVDPQAPSEPEPRSIPCAHT